ncbi:hypothetical protein AAE478_001658 [Parahypoxylon ruwenzoriense]
MCSSDLFLGLLAILFPPLPVWVKCGLCSADSIVNILLCILGYVSLPISTADRRLLTIRRAAQIPGLLHSWYIIAKYPELADYEPLPQDSERGGRVTYVFVQQPSPQPSPRPQPQPQSKSGAQPNYGGTTTTSAADGPSSSSAAGPANGSSSGADHDDADRAPPTYAEAVKGDNKIQTHD